MLIAGGGIGGLAAALALSQQGFAVRLFEARPEPDEAGAGLQLSANAVKALRVLGLEDAVAEHANRPALLELRLPGSGRTVSRVKLGETHEARFGAPYLQLHRAHLHRVLFDAARLRPNIEIQLDARVAKVAHAPASVSIQLEDGTEIDGAVLIGADGVHSVVRRGVSGADEPRFTGMMAWRAVVPAAPGDSANVTVWMGRGRHLVHYPIAGGTQINLVGVVEREGWTDESWTAPGEPAAMAADFAGYDASVDALLGRVETPWRWALFERKPLSVWSAGRVALLGDACHAMPPFLAQGAALALEDAVVLARIMAANRDDLTHALRDYTAARHDRTAEVQKASWQNAWRFHLKGDVMRTCVYGALGFYDLLMPGRAGRMFDWVYSYDAAAEGPKE